MGFALWIEGDVAWSEGRHEYQPMGTAVVARSDLFRERDFRRSRRRLSAAGPGYAGLFASLGDMNDFLRSQRRPVTTPREKNRGSSNRSH
jgi:hypothetical protein